MALLLTLCTLMALLTFIGITADFVSRIVEAKRNASKEASKPVFKSVLTGPVSLR